MRNQQVINILGMDVEVLLTSRLIDTYLLIVQGHAYADVGIRLGLSENTVKIYAERIFHSLGFSSRVELQGEIVRQACQGKLLPYLQSVVGHRASEIYAEHGTQTIQDLFRLVEQAHDVARIAA